MAEKQEESAEVQIAKRAAKAASSLALKKLLLWLGPFLVIGLVILLILFLLMTMMVGVLGGAKGGYEAIYENERCIDVGSASPRVTASGQSGGGGGAGPSAGAGQMGWPTPETSVVTSEFGARWGEVHDGMDIADEVGTPIYAVADGEVTRSGPASGYGNWITIKHEIDGEVVETLYGHQIANHVQVGDQVTAGQHIADMGNEGYSFGSHLHFGVYPGGWSQGAGVDPMPWLDKFKAQGGGTVKAEEGDGEDSEGESTQAAGPSTVAYDLVADVQYLAQDGGGTVTAADWEKLAQCESGGNWAIDTGNGFSGGLQFTQETWEGFNGTEFAPTAKEAGREEQMEVANRVLAEQGWGAWPACSGKLSELQGLKPAPPGTFIGGGESGSDGGGESTQTLPPSEKGNEDGLQVETINIMRNVEHQFPDLTEIGGYREDSLEWHPSGRALDIMFPNYEDPAEVARGDEVASYLQDNADEFGIDHIMWQKQIWYPGNAKDQWDPQDDTGSPTGNHMDHIHVAVTDGGGFPTDATTYHPVGEGPAPSGGGASGGQSDSDGGGGTQPYNPDGPAAQSDLPGLTPYDPEDSQLSMQINVEQQATVKAIISSAKESKLTEEQAPRAAVLATMLSGQQANFINLTGEENRERVGIFAEAPNWQNPRYRLTNPKVVAGDFYADLLDEYGDDDSWMTDPAAEVLVRVYPNRQSLEVELAKWESIAADSVAALWDSRGAQEGVSLPDVFEDVEECAVGATDSNGTADPGAALQSGKVPPGWEKWFELGAMECEAVSAPVLAAQAFHEGGFQPHEPRPVGGGQTVGGITQFETATWQTHGYDVDDQGRQTGEPGAGDWNDPADAIMAQARFNCDNAEMIQGWMDEGKVQGDITEMMLGAYLGGPGAILSAGGLNTTVSDINGSTPASYAKLIIDMSEDYTDMEASKNSHLNKDDEEGDDGDDSGDDEEEDS